jgi:lysophospholipase L1-like esterase
MAVGFRAPPMTIHLSGDSTMAPKEDNRRPETGWGEMLAAHFDSTQVRIENHARNGRSTRSFIAEGRWDSLLARVRPGDWVFIQFGHNDGAQDRPDRYTPPGDYDKNLERMVGDARRVGGNQL